MTTNTFIEIAIINPHKPIFNKEKPKVDTSESNKNVNTPIYSPNSIFDSYDEDISIDDLPKLK